MVSGIVQRLSGTVRQVPRSFLLGFKAEERSAWSHRVEEVRNFRYNNNGSELKQVASCCQMNYLNSDMVDSKFSPEIQFVRFL